MSRPEADQWSAISDPVERRKIQNKLAQRRFREHFPRGSPTFPSRLLTCLEVIKSKNKRRNQSANRKIIAMREARIRLQSLTPWTRRPYSRDYRGEESI